MSVNSTGGVSGAQSVNTETELKKTQKQQEQETGQAVAEAENELQETDITDGDLEQLTKLLGDTQLSAIENVSEKYKNTILQIQQEIEDIKKEKRSLIAQIEATTPKEGEENNSKDILSQISNLNSKANKLNTQLIATITQYETSMKELSNELQQSIMSAAAGAQSGTASASTVGAESSETAAVSSGGKIASGDGASAQIDGYIEKYANEAGLDPNFVKAVIKAESSFNPNAQSGAGAQGLMQLMPATARSLGVSNSFDPEENIKGGVKYLKQMYEQFGSYDLALAAYNAGPGAVQKYGGVPPYNETQNYVKKVNQYWQSYKNA